MRNRHLLAVALFAVLCVASLAGAAPAQAGVNDYPTSIAGCYHLNGSGPFTCDLKDSAPDSCLIWRELNRECTSFVAWRLHSRNGFDMPFHDNALGWGSRRTSTRLHRQQHSPGRRRRLVDTGKVATSHVAWVESVNGSTVTVEEYNAKVAYGYDERVLSSPPTDYIHFKDISGGSGGGPSAYDHIVQWETGTPSHRRRPGSWGQIFIAVGFRISRPTTA